MEWYAITMQTSCSGISLPVIDEEHGIAIDSCAVVYENDCDFGHIVLAPLHSSDVIQRELPSTKADPKSLEHLTPEQQMELLTLLDVFLKALDFQVLWCIGSP